MPVYTPIISTMTPITTKLKRPVNIFKEEAAQYLTFWCKTHHNWAPLELGTFSERLALESVCRNDWAWELKWSSNSPFEHPVSGKYRDAKRFCFVLTERAFEHDHEAIHEKSLSLRGWVTCWADDTIHVKLAVI